MFMQKIHTDLPMNHCTFCSLDRLQAERCSSQHQTECPLYRLSLVYEQTTWTPFIQMNFHIMKFSINPIQIHMFVSMNSRTTSFSPSPLLLIALSYRSYVLLLPFITLLLSYQNHIGCFLCIFWHKQNQRNLFVTRRQPVYRNQIRQQS